MFVVRAVVQLNTG